MAQLIVALTASLMGPGRPHRPAAVRTGARRRLRGASGQTTVEYALVLLGAAAIASLVIAWASGTDAVGRLMDLVMAHVVGSVK